MRSMLLCAVLLTGFVTASARAQTSWPTQPGCPPGAFCMGPTLRYREPQHDPGAFARGAAIFGVVSSGLLLGGSIAIAAVDDVQSERITRGVWLGTLTLSVPFVALGAWTARHRTDVEGYRALRLLGWSAWAGGITSGIVQWYEAFHDRGHPWPLTTALGVVGAMAVLPHALDAFVSGRRATLRARTTGVSVGPGAITIRF